MPLPNLKLCPYKTCDRRTPNSKFMCAEHWGMVPKALQRAIYAAWRRYQRDPRGAAGELRAAQQDALEAIGGN